MDYSILASFNESTLGFSSGRTSPLRLPDTSWVRPSTSPWRERSAPRLRYGVGTYQASNICLSTIPSTEFWTGVDQNGNQATRYFAGTVNGQPTWSTSESGAVPVVNDVDPTNPTVVNVSVIYSQQLGLWLMTFDGGRNAEPPRASILPTPPSQGWGNFIFLLLCHPVGEYASVTSTTNTVSVAIGGVAVPQADVTFSGLVGAGLYQLNIVVPSNLGTGDKAIVAAVGGAQTQSGLLLSLQ